jgi:hypothetical protein
MACVRAVLSGRRRPAPEKNQGDEDVTAKDRKILRAIEEEEIQREIESPVATVTVKIKAARRKEKKPPKPLTPPKPAKPAANRTALIADLVAPSRNGASRHAKGHANGRLLKGAYVLKRTRKANPLRGKRHIILNLIRDGMTVAQLSDAAVKKVRTIDQHHARYMIHYFENQGLVTVKRPAK